MKSAKRLILLLMCFLMLTLNVSAQTETNKSTQSKKSAQTKKNLTKKKRTKHKKVLYEPASYDKMILLITKGKEWKYYRFTPEKPLKLEAEGTTVLEFRIRLLYDATMKGGQNFTLTLEEEGLLTKSVAASFSFNAQKSRITSVKGEPQLVPSTGDEFKFTVPNGKHTYLVSLRGTDAKAAALRVLIPEKDVRQVKVSDPKGKRSSVWKFRGVVDSFYDDNIFQYSEENVDAFNPSLNKFEGLDSPDDVVYQVLGSLEYQPRRLRGVSILFSAAPRFYQRNTDKSYQVYSVRLEQDFSNDYTFLLRYTFLPRFFQLRTADPPNQSRTYSNAFYQRQTIGTELEKQFSEQWTSSLFAEFGWKHYNDVFPEQDIKVMLVGIGSSFRANRKFRLNFDTTYDRGIAAGKGDTTVNYDTSYRRWSVSVRPVWRFARRFSLNGEIEFDWKQYTSDLLRDRNHFHRNDTTKVYDVQLIASITNQVDARIEFERIHRDSNRENANLDFANFDENRFSGGFVYSF
jgi:hypothetical protein